MNDTNPSKQNPTIAVDFDGVLAWYNEGQSIEQLGHPIPGMIQWVRYFMAKGFEVVVFTARVYEHPERIEQIQNWLEDNGLPRFEVTCQKKPSYVLMIDDRCLLSPRNTGSIPGASDFKLPESPAAAQQRKVLNFRF